MGFNRGHWPTLADSVAAVFFRPFELSNVVNPKRGHARPAASVSIVPRVAAVSVAFVTGRGGGFLPVIKTALPPLRLREFLAAAVKVN